MGVVERVVGTVVATVVAAVVAVVEVEVTVGGRVTPTGRQTRSLTAVGAVASYSPALHTVVFRHSRSCAAVHGRKINWLAAHCEHVLQTRFRVAVQLVEEKLVPSTQAVQGRQMVFRAPVHGEKANVPLVHVSHGWQRASLLSLHGSATKVRLPQTVHAWHARSLVAVAGLRSNCGA